ncbi:hypothetical protein [Haloferula sp.]|uniref:hypothetical protein n=1 Tax=Haloferula sp. TaxID=2497595 RepID=UPI003C73BC26
MQPPETVRRSPRTQQRGFALLACMLVMSLLVLVVVALLSLSAVELRKATADQDLAAARANARMALIHAIGQLQAELGPDQRVSATAGILDQSGSPNWTGVWSTQPADGSSYWIRDEKTGSLIDRRDEEGWDARSEVRSWLVSGEGDPAVPLGRDAGVELVGAGSVDDAEAMVTVPLVKLDEQQGRRGGLAWWTGDLGVRANVATPDRYGEEEVDPLLPGEGHYRLMVSQHAEPALMGKGIELEAAKRSSLATPNSVALLGAGSRDWSRKHFHDFTTSSRGLLTDVRDGGLKSDLSAYFESDGQISSLGDRPGLRDDESMISGGLVTRRQLAGPRFGMLRDWVTQAVPFSGREVAARAPATDADGGRKSEDYAQCNENPVRLIGNTTTSLNPVLVEASNFVQISTYPLSEEPPVEYQMRHHLYPRVVFWNPYNVEMRSDDMMVMIQGNGRWEMWTENEYFNRFGRLVKDRTPWISFEGGRSTSFYEAESGKAAPLMASAGYNDPYMGSYYFMVPATSFGPGECLVFSPEGSAEYDGLSVYNSGSYDLSSNRLSCEVAPDPSRSYYVSASDLGGGLNKRPVRFWHAPIYIWSSIARDGKNNFNGVENQSDDTRVVVKKLEGSGPVTFDRFDELPQVSYISASLQYGAGKEPRIAWDDDRLMDVELLSKSSPSPTLEPDPRTREGIRLRWFEEPLSNILNSGGLADQEQVFQEAFFANWNPRAAFSVRSPWENLGGTLPSSGSGGGPWFFGLYTRDLGDSAVGWGSQEPVFRDGRYHGNPFGLPQESSGSHVLFELPRQETGVVSLGQLQNAQISQFVWHPSFAIGNSLIDPRLGLENSNRTIPPSGSDDEDAKGGFHPDVIGWSVDDERSLSKDDWAKTGRAMLQGVPEEDHVVYDLSYEANHALWDRFFVSSGDRMAKGKFADDPALNPLPNGRMSLVSSTRGLASGDRLNDFHRAAYHLSVDGAFNINSTSVEAWKAMLAATRGAAGGEGTPFGRLLDRVAGPDAGVGADGQGGLWTSFRMLDDREVERLAIAIVEEVKLRGPFLSMSDFVNRRLGTDELSRKGALQAAIDKAGINESFNAAYPINNQEPLEDYDHPDNIRDATRLEQTLKPESQAWGAPGFLTQGDVLQVLAPALSARSDSFIIRAYGETSNASGEVLARAWCEAVVQRTPIPVKPDATGLNSADLGEAGDFGRRFIVTGFRWLRPDEV